MIITTNPAKLDNCLLVISHMHTYPDSPWIHISSVLSSVNRSSDAPECVSSCPQDRSQVLRSPQHHPLRPMVDPVQDCTWHTCLQRCPSMQAAALLASEVCLPRVRVLGCVPRTALGCWVPTGCTLPSQNSGARPKPSHTWWWDLAQPCWWNVEKEILGGQAWCFITSIATAVSLHRALWI